MEKNHFYQKVYLTVSKIPYGKVATYGQISDLIYAYGKARQVGWALRRLKLTLNIPWHRVINSKGFISVCFSRYGTDWMQRELLINKGIKVKNWCNKIFMEIKRKCITEKKITIITYMD